jgi:tail lysozyme
MADNAAYAYNYLRRRLRLTPAQAAGAVGGLTGESGRNLDPNAVNPTSGALGIGQWLGARARGVKKGDFKGQLAHLVAELQGPESAAFNRLRSAHTIEDATRAWVEGFERPSAGEIAQSMPTRLANARDIFKQLSGQPVHGVGAIPQSNAAGVPGSMLASAANSQTDRLSSLSTILQRLEASRPAPIQYKSPLERSLGNSDPNMMGPQGQQGMGLSHYGLDYEPPKLSDTVNSLIASLGTQNLGPQGSTNPNLPTVPGGGAPARSGGGVSGKNLPKGTDKFEGHTVAAWIAPVLQYAREHGWKGQVNSGFRSFADQQRIYNSGVRPAAKPGTSNHEGAEFPRGAVDVSDAQQLSDIIRRSKYRNLLQWAGSKDPVHFSHPHNGSY